MAVHVQSANSPMAVCIYRDIKGSGPDSNGSGTRDVYIATYDRNC